MVESFIEYERLKKVYNHFFCEDSEDSINVNALLHEAHLIGVVDYKLIKLEEKLMKIKERLREEILKFELDNLKSK